MSDGLDPSYIIVMAPDDYPGPTYDGRIYEHHLVYWEAYGTLPGPGQMIHHLDENKANNFPGNLELVSAKEHAQLHAAPTHMVELCCPACGKIFRKPIHQTFLRNGSTYTACSRSCAGKLAHHPARADGFEGNAVRQYWA
jgi:hypothetical protein